MMRARSDCMESFCNDPKYDMIKMGIYHTKSEHSKISFFKEIESQEKKQKFNNSISDKTKLVILTCCAVLLATLITTSLNISDVDFLGFIVATILFSYLFFIMGIGPVFKI
jgi:type III secretory pathway component EscR